jgi:hypothetical protein
MNDPLAYFITWGTYGNWLPGDQRGWAKKKTWGIQPPDRAREQLAREHMTEDAVTLAAKQRRIVEAVIIEHCRIRGWQLHACNPRTTHVHVVVTAFDVDPEKVREQFKAWCSRRLSEDAGLIGAGKDGQRRWWAEGGDIVLVYDEEHLAAVIRYVNEAQ